MKVYNLLSLFILGFFVISCGNSNQKNSANFSLQIGEKDENIQQGKAVKIQLQQKEAQEIDSVTYFYNGEKIKVENNSITFNLPLGKNKLEANIYSEGDKTTLTEEVSVHSNVKPKLYTYEIVNTYPHDSQAFTQGLEFYNDTLYESTGLRGQSTLRKVDLESGKVLKKIDLIDTYFAEGLTIYNNKIYQLTWRSGDGIIYDLNTFEKKEIFNYNESKEGWGLCNDGEKFYKSDGTEKIWILNPETLAEESFIQPATHKTTLTKLNELEWVEGKIYANTWQKDGVVIIDPKTGAVEGLIDFRGLREKLTNNDELVKSNHVLNGIAYNPNNKKLYVTGKNWDKLFEVKIIER